MDADFEWDEHKNKQNLRKHGVSFEEAQYVFKDILRIIHEDREHSAMKNDTSALVNSVLVSSRYVLRIEIRKFA